MIIECNFTMENHVDTGINHYKIFYRQQQQTLVIFIMILNLARIIQKYMSQEELTMRLNTVKKYVFIIQNWLLFLTKPESINSRLFQPCFFGENICLSTDSLYIFQSLVCGV